jgi:hypothetical protein
MRLLAAILVALALIAAGCGDDDDEKKADPAGTTTAETTTPSTAEEPTTTETTPAPPAEASEEDKKAVEQAVLDWTFEGKCDLMTDKFLEQQLLGLGDNREERCDLFEKQHQKPQYGEDQVKIEDVEVSGTKASLIVTSDIAPDIKSKYDLVKTGDQWQIDAAELQ